MKKIFTLQRFFLMSKYVHAPCCKIYSTPGNKTMNSDLESIFGSTVMMVLLAFSKVIIYSDGHSLER